jgi:hypothetical protein
MFAYVRGEQNMFSYINNHNAVCRVLLNKVVQVVARVSRSPVLLSCLVLRGSKYLASHTQGSA